MTKDFELKVLGTPTALERTKEAMRTKWVGNPARINQAKSFINKAKKSDKRRKIEKKSRKRNRK